MLPSAGLQAGVEGFGELTGLLRVQGSGLGNRKGLRIHRGSGWCRAE